jgi:hypothetical protein
MFPSFFIGPQHVVGGLSGRFGPAALTVLISSGVVEEL